MKKRLLFLAIGASIGFSAYSQVQSQSALPDAKYRVAPPQKYAVSDKAVGSYYVDAEAYDGFLLANPNSSFVAPLNRNFQDTGEFGVTYQIYKQIARTTDYNNFEMVPNENITSMTIDSIFINAAHFRSPSTPSNVYDSIFVSLVRVDANGRPVEAAPSDIYWIDTLATNVDLSGQPSGTGYPTTVIKFSPNITLPAAAQGSFAIRVEYRAPIGDSLMPVVSYPTDGTSQCLTTDAIFPSIFYPSAFYRIVLPPAISVLIPLPSGDYYWYYDCNGNQDADGAAENPYQTWSQWAFVTMADNVSIEEQPIAGLNYVYAAPNPVADMANITFAISKNIAKAELKITDITGKELQRVNLGSLTNGKYTRSIDFNQYPAGIYMYTLILDGQSTTGKLIK